MTKQNKIRLGVLGCANIAKRSMVPAILQLPELFELKYIASRRMEKAEDFAREFGLTPVEGYDNLIASDDIDALYIPLPTGLHKEYVNKALKAGKHVYVEKAVAMNHNDALEMVGNARANDAAMMEGFMFQYHSQHDVVRNLLAKDTIGDVRHFSATFCFPPLPEGNFRYSPTIGGGVLTDAAGYPLRATHFMMGDAMQVKAATLKFDPQIGSHVYGSAFLSDEKGLGASIAFGFDNFYQCYYEILGQKGKITATRAYTPKPDFKPSVIVETPQGTETIVAEADNHFVKAMEEFYHIICSADGRKKHYSDILLQSSSLDQIYNLSTSTNE